MPRFAFLFVATIFGTCLYTGASSFAQNQIDPSTRWTFQAHSPCVVNSSVVRLGDLITPTDPNMAAWRRLKDASIALIPVRGQTMRIDRDRLHDILLSAEATANQIRIQGPATIEVRYEKQTRAMGPAATIAATSGVSGSSEHLRQAQFQTRPLQSHYQANSIDLPPVNPTVSRMVSERFERWAKLAIERFYPEIKQAGEIAVTMDPAGLQGLSSISGVDHCVALSAIDTIDQPMQADFRMSVRDHAGRRNVDVTASFTPHPRVVVARRPIGRGQRLSAADVHLQPVPVSRVVSGAVHDLQSVIGKETRTNLRVGKPIDAGDVGNPILVHRGDLIELVVRSGGVKITTAGKAIDGGSAGELIEVETLEPRRRIAARVVEIGIAEITTRAPMVR